MVAGARQPARPTGLRWASTVAASGYRTCSAAFCAGPTPSTLGRLPAGSGRPHPFFWQQASCCCALWPSSLSSPCASRASWRRASSTCADCCKESQVRLRQHKCIYVCVCVCVSELVCFFFLYNYKVIIGVCLPWCSSVNLCCYHNSWPKYLYFEHFWEIIQFLQLDITCLLIMSPHSKVIKIPWKFEENFFEVRNTDFGVQHYHCCCFCCCDRPENFLLVVWQNAVT